EHRAGAQELETGAYEKIRFTVASEGLALHGSNARRPHAQEALGRLYSRDVPGGNFEMLGVEFVSVDRLKSSESHMQRDIGDAGSGAAARVQNFRSEVQAGCRSSDRSRGPREHGLISFAVFRAIRTFDIGR